MTPIVYSILPKLWCPRALSANNGGDCDAPSRLAQLGSQPLRHRCLDIGLDLGAVERDVVALDQTRLTAPRQHLREEPGKRREMALPKSLMV